MKPQKGLITNSCKRRKKKWTKGNFPTETNEKEKKKSIMFLESKMALD